MLLSPASPSLAAALVGTSAGEDVVAVVVDVAAVAMLDDTGVGVTVVTVVPEVIVLAVMARVQETVESEVADVDGSMYVVQLVSEV